MSTKLQSQGLSVRTIESHRAHIQQKTGRTSRADLVSYARHHGLIALGGDQT